MHVAIDLDNLRFTHIHTDHNLLSGLVYLEGAKLRHVLYDDSRGHQFLDRFTTLELNFLYRNTTGRDFPANLDDLARRQVLAELVEGMQPRTVIESELDAQTSAVWDQLELPVAASTQFRYVKGAQRPAVADDGLFPITCQPPSAAELVEAAQRAPQQRSPRAAPVTPAAPQPRPARPAAPRSASPGGARPAIFAHADKMWEAVGKPMDKNAVLVLRKKWMIELEEEQGIKKSTSSTALGDWMKDRLG